MAQVNKTTLKSYFVKGAQPTQQQFANLIESATNSEETGVQYLSGSLEVVQNITASNISASGTIFANNFQSAGGDVAGVTFVDSVSLTGDMTASGNLIISGNVTLGDGCDDQITINGTVTASCDISSSANLDVGGNTRLFGDSAVISPAKLYFGNSNVLNNAQGIHIYSEGTATDEDQIILAKTNDLRILNQAHGRDIEFGTENASGTAFTPLTLKGDGQAIFSGNITASANVSASGTQNVLGGLNIPGNGGLTVEGNTVLAAVSASGEVIAASINTTHITSSGNISSSGNLTIGGTTRLEGDTTITSPDKLYLDGPNGLHIYSEGTDTNEDQIILAKTNDLRILNQAHGKSIEFGTEDGGGTAFTPLTLTGGHITASNNISASGIITAEHLISSDDAEIGDNLTLTSDSSVFAMGVHADFTITHDGTTGATLAGNPITIDSAGALNLYGAAINIGTDTDVAIDIDSAALDIDSSGAITIDGAGISLDSAGAAANLTVASDGNADDLTISVTGATDSSLILASAGTGTDAISIDATAGDMLIAPSLTDGKTLKIGKNGAVEAVFAPHGTAGNEKFTLTNTAGTATDAIDLTATAGGINLSGAIKGIGLTGPVTASTHISASGNILTSGGVTALGTIQAEQLTSTDDISATGDVTSENLIVKSEILHHGNIQTKIIFDTDSIRFDAGGEQMLKFVEDDSQDKIVFGDGGDIDFEFSGTGQFKFTTDSTDHAIQQHDGNEVARVHDGGATQSDTDMTSVGYGFGFKHPIMSVTADSGDTTVSLSADDSGAIIQCDADTNNIIFNLPVIDAANKAGIHFTFVTSTAVNGSKTIVINTAGTDGNDNFLLHNHSKNAYDHAGDTITIPNSAPIGTVLKVTCLSSGASNAAELWLVEGFTDNIAITNA